MSIFGVNQPAMHTNGGVYDKFAELMGILATAPNQRRKIENDREEKRLDREIRKSDSDARNRYYDAMTGYKAQSAKDPKWLGKMIKVKTPMIGPNGQPVLDVYGNPLMEEHERAPNAQEVQGMIDAEDAYHKRTTGGDNGTSTGKAILGTPPPKEEYVPLPGYGELLDSGFDQTSAPMDVPTSDEPAPLPPNQPIGGDQLGLPSAISGVLPQQAAAIQAERAVPPVRAPAPMAQAPAPQSPYAGVVQPAPTQNMGTVTQNPTNQGTKPAPTIAPEQLDAMLRSLPLADQAAYQRIVATGDPAKVQEAHRLLQQKAQGMLVGAP